MTDRAPGHDTHHDACHGTRCPCLLEGQRVADQWRNEPMFWFVCSMIALFGAASVLVRAGHWAFGVIVVIHVLRHIAERIDA